MTDEERLEQTAVKAFRKHWEKIAGTLEKGRNTYADKLYGCFQAGTSARQKILAERFYGLGHSRKMAALSEKALKRNLTCYLQKAVGYALSEHEDEPGEQEAFMKRLVTCEYVIFNSHQGGCLEDYDEDVDDLWMAEFPARVFYDDWYERSIGCSLYNCSTSVLMKSTGEAFSKKEIDWLKESVQRNIDGNDPWAFWWFECEPLARNKIWVKIYDFEIDKSVYMEGFLNEAASLSRDELLEFVRRTLKHLYGEKKSKRMLSAINGYESVRESDLFPVVEDFFLKNWETGALSDYDIRAAENVMNDITGRKDRNYHYGIL